MKREDSKAVIVLALFIGGLLFLFLPQIAKALTPHLLDPLSVIHKGLNIDYQRYRYRYSFKQDILPQEPKKQMTKRGGGKFTVVINDPRSILRIGYYGESLIDPAGVEEPTLVIDPPKGRSITKELNKPVFYFKDLGVGRYRFRINGIGREYSYRFDIDLVDYQLGGQIAYLSDLFDAEKDFFKVEDFLRQKSFSGRVLITSNQEICSRFGIEESVKKIPDRIDDPILTEIRSVRGQIRTLKVKKGGWQPVYSTEIGDLAVVLEYSENPSSQIIFLSRDLTSLDPSALSPLKESLRKTLLLRQQKKDLWFWLAGAIIILVLAFIISRNLEQTKEILRAIRKRLGSFFRRQRRNIGLVVVAALIIAGLLLIIRHLFKNQTSPLGNFFGQVDEWLMTIGVMRAYLWILFLGLFLLLTELLLYWKEIVKILTEYGSRIKGELVTVFLLLLLVVELYNLAFNWWPSCSWLFLALITLVVLWLIVLKNNNQKMVSKSPRYRQIMGVFLILIIMAPLLLAIKSTMAIWWPGTYKKRYSLKVSKGRIVSSAGLRLKTPLSDLTIEDDALLAKELLSFSLKPNQLFKQPDRISISTESGEDALIYLITRDENKIKQYLLNYPYQDCYQEVFSQDEIAAWSRRKIGAEIKRVKAKKIEDFITGLPNKYSVEISSSLIQQERDLVKSDRGLIDISRFYRRNIRIDDKAINTFKANFIAGRYELYTFLGNSLRLKIVKHDLNQKLGRDEVYLAVFGPNGEPIRSLKLEDDWLPLGQEGDRQSFHLALEGLEEGVYNFKLFDYSNHDMVIDQIVINSPYLIAEKDDLLLYSDPRRLYLPEPDSDFLSFGKKGFFYPYQRALNSPGSQSDILIYRIVDSFDSVKKSDNKYWDFALGSLSGEPFKIKELIIDYLYY